MAQRTARPISYTALADAKRDGSLVSWLAEMTPAERVEAAQVCAANSRRTVSEWLATFGELMEAAELALEARAAVADSEAALAEERRDRYEIHGENSYDAAVWDTATESTVWRGPREQADAAWARIVAEGPLTSPIPAGADIEQSIERRAIFDALCEAVDELRDYWRDVPKRLEMINSVWEAMILAETFYFDARGNLLVESSTPGKWYAVGHTCPCDAGRWGSYCRHSVQADILGRAHLIARMQRAA